MTNDLPDPLLVKRLLARYSAVRLDVSVDHLADGDRLALRRLAEMSTWIDRIYWKQRSEQGWRLKQRVAGLTGEAGGELKRLLDLNFGPWDTFSDDRPFWGSQPRPAGGSLYPPDLTRAELEDYLDRHPEQRESLLSHRTLVRRQADRLVATPYEVAYKEELAQVAKGLDEASALASHAGYRGFLRSRAHDLVTGPLEPSERLWVGVADSPIDVAVGPYEVYDDELMGLKTSYEATVMVRHPMTERLRQFESIAAELEQRLPGAVAPARSRRKVVVGVYDVTHAAGMTNMGGKAIAATLPNDERVRFDAGARLLLFRNVIVAKVEPILQPLSARLLHPEQRELVREDAFLAHTLLHEMAHAVSARFVGSGDAPTGTTANEALRERYSTIEECRADLLGLVFVDHLTHRGLFPAEMRAASAVTFVADRVRALRFGARDDHSRGAAIILSRLLRKGAVRVGLDGRLVVDVDGVQRGVAELAETVQTVTTRGDYKAAGDLIGDLGSMPAELERLLPGLSDIPIDLEFVFDDSRRLR